MVNSDYQVLLEPAALQDIQRVVDYYDERQTGLGERFVSAFEKHLIPIQKNPFFRSGMIMSVVYLSRNTLL